MNIKPDLDVCTSDFWYDLAHGGYLKPEEILEDPEDIQRVKEAIVTLKEFEDACESTIEGFIQ